MQSSFWTTSDASNFPTNTSNFWPNGGYRKRKISESDLEGKSGHKIFLTEERLVRNMQTLSLDLSVNNPTFTPQNSQDDEEGEHSSANQPQLQLHQLLKDNLRKDDLQDNLINKLYDLERKKLSMQIVPYMPIHPAQLNSNNLSEKEEEEGGNPVKSPTPPSPTPINEIKKENDDHLFKKPFLPPPYYVEEPPETTTKRLTRMKRSYSQSLRSNSNLSVTELRDDTPLPHSATDYLIFEPTTPSLPDSSSNCIFSSYSSNRPSIRITEYFDFPSSDFPNDIDMESMIVSDTYDATTEEM